MPFDFGSMTDTKETDSGQAVATTKFDFSTMEDAEPPPPVNQGVSIISKVARAIFRTSPIERFTTSLYLQDKLPEVDPSESLDSYQKKVEAVLAPREEAIIKGGIGKQLEPLFQASAAVGMVTAPAETAIFMAAYPYIDKYVPIKRFADEHFPNTWPVVKDIVELLDIGLKGGFLGKGIFAGRKFLMGRLDSLAIPRNVNIDSSIVAAVKDSGNLLPEEKADMFKTLGIENKHIDASLSGGVPINVPTNKIMDLAEKPYWEVAKHELLGGALGEVMDMESIAYGRQQLADYQKGEEGLDLSSIIKEFGGISPYKKGMPGTLAEEYSGIPNHFKNKKTGMPLDEMAAAIESNYPHLGITDEASLINAIENAKMKKINKKIKQPVAPIPRASQALINDLKTLQVEKKISNVTLKRLKDFTGVESIKQSPEPLVKKLVSFVEDLKPEDKFLSPKQLTDLKDIIKGLPNPEVTPKRVVLETFGEKTNILNKGMLSVVAPELIPSVDIKEGHPLVTRVLDKVSEKMIKAEDLIHERNKELDKLLTAAEESREPLLPLDENLKRKLYPQNKEIASVMGGEHVQLTKKEVEVVDYLKGFFQKVKEEILKKSRRYYLPHLEKPFIEKILEYGLLPAIRDLFVHPKPGDLPVDIMLELDNIIGSEKFFKFALERKGGVDPTTNIRRIVNEYSYLYETKKVLDEVLPEGQAITKNLLREKSAVWMKKFLQNLKGRGMDSNFRNGPMGWLAKTADAIVDIGYLKMLALPGGWKSSLKNLIAGEVNSWIFQDFETYLTGKRRFFSDPKKAYKLAQEYGALEGTYSDFAQKGIGALKKYQDYLMIGQKVGEIEIRSSICASMLSEKEWESGEVPAIKFDAIKDVIAKTQGVFSKWDSPLVLQTWYGRMFFQMNRWRITNTLLLRRIVSDAYVDIKAGNYRTQNVVRLGKMLSAYGVGMYLAYQLSRAGFKTASDVARNMAQTVDGIVSLFGEGELIKMFTDNPTLSLFKEISHTIQNTAHYLHVPGARKTKERGITKTYIAPLKGAKDIQKSLSQG